MIAQTSLEAYENIKPKIKGDQLQILSVLDPENGLTFREIAKKLHWLEPIKVSRRMSELVRQNKVEIKETRICSISKSRCSSYIKI